MIPSLTKSNRLGIHILNALHLRPKIRIMEINAGENTLIRDILNIDDSIRYFGLEYAPNVAKELNKQYKTYTGKRKAIYCDFDSENIPYVPNFFHRIVYSNPKQLKTNPSWIFNEVFRVLYGDGFFVLTFSGLKDSEQTTLVSEAKKVGFHYLHKKIFIKNIIDIPEYGNPSESVLMLFKKPMKQKILTAS